MKIEFYLPEIDIFYKSLPNNFIRDNNNSYTNFYIHKDDLEKYKNIFNKANFTIINKKTIDYIFFVELSKNKKYDVISYIADKYIVKLADYMGRFYFDDFLEDNIKYFLNQDILNLNKQIKLDINLKIYYILYMFKNFDFVNIDNIDDTIKEFRENKFLTDKIPYYNKLTLKNSYLNIIKDRIQDYLKSIFNKYDNIKNIKIENLNNKIFNGFKINVYIKDGNKIATFNKFIDIRDKLESLFNYFKLEMSVIKHDLNDIEFFNKFFNNINDFLLSSYFEYSYINIKFTDILKSYYELFKLTENTDKIEYIRKMKKISKRNMNNILFYLFKG